MVISANSNAQSDSVPSDKQLHSYTKKKYSGMLLGISGVLLTSAGGGLLYYTGTHDNVLEVTPTLGCIYTFSGIAMTTTGIILFFNNSRKERECRAKLKNVSVVPLGTGIYFSYRF